MRFPHFWHRRTPDETGDELATSHAWQDSGLAAEVEAFLAGRMVDHLVAHHQPVPAWAVINRLAHSDRPQLVCLVEGVSADPFLSHPSAQPRWEASERFVAGHLLATTGSPDDLWRLQRATLVPLELRLIERTKVEHISAEQVLEAGVEALDGFRPGR
jgi:hypothetical protein